MTFVVLLACIASFVTYFYTIWLQYVWLIPIVIFLVGISYYMSWFSVKKTSWDVFKNYWLVFAWIIMLLGLYLILNFFGINDINWFLFLLGINIVFWLVSYFLWYNDGKKISQTWYYLSIVVLLWYVWTNFWFDNFFDVFNHFWILSLAINSFVIFVIWLKFKIENYLKYNLFVLSIWATILILYHQIANIYIFLSVCVLFLWILYFWLYKIISNKPPTENQKKEISVRRILAGEKILNKMNKNNSINDRLYVFVSWFPKIVKYCLEVANMIIVLILIYLYFKNTFLWILEIEQFFYWFVIFGFVVNVFLLKRLNYTSAMQRFLTFLVINFAIYISLFALFKSNIWNIVFLWMLWNIFSAMMVFHVHKTKAWNYLRKIDYVFWLFTTAMAMLLNIVLLFRTNIHWELLFPIILLYVWIQWMMMYYATQYVNKIQEVEEYLES